jgi:hypothetical protein
MQEYQSALEDLKAIILPTVIESTKVEASANNVLAQFWAEHYYTLIMALGYNYGDAQKAIEDILEQPTVETNMLLENIKTEVQYVRVLQSRIEFINKALPNCVKAFSQFHRLSQDGISLTASVEEAAKILL